jgi:hypothetical protein
VTTASRHAFAWLSARGKQALVAFALMLALAPALSAIPASAAALSPTSPISSRAPVTTDPNPGDGQQKCKPHPGEGVNPHCPPPVVPEAPMAILLPLSAGAVLGVAYLFIRRRSGTNPA